MAAKNTFGCFFSAVEKERRQDTAANAVEIIAVLRQLPTEIVILT